MKRRPVISINGGKWASVIIENIELARRGGDENNNVTERENNDMYR